MAPRLMFSPLVLLILFIIAGSAFVSYAFASANTGPSPVSGEGANVISGYDVTNVSFHSDSDPRQIDSVSFTLNAAANFVKIKLIASQSNWYNCNPLSGNDWVCVTTGATVISADQLTVVASNK
jgi:hypothetical protein